MFLVLLVFRNSFVLGFFFQKPYCLKNFLTPLFRVVVGHLNLESCSLDDAIVDNVLKAVSIIIYNCLTNKGTICLSNK
jgi:hypothetical protein